MTQEEKELLLKDLCARLPYYPHIYVNKYLPNIELTLQSEVYEYVMCEASCKPYIRPISSMTEEEMDTYDTLTMCNAPWVVVDWLNKKMFDYRKDDEGKTMIEKGLALEAPEGMYDIKNK